MQTLLALLTLPAPLSPEMQERARAIRLDMRKRRRRALEWKASKPSRSRPRCKAKTRSGALCRRLVVSGRKRCPNHGGLSTGPRTESGRAAVAASNRRRVKTRAASGAEVVLCSEAIRRGELVLAELERRRR